MATALAYLAPGIFGAGGSAALFATTAGVTSLTLLGSAVNILGGLVLNAAAGALLAPDAPEVIGPESIKVNVAAETNPRIRHYGQVRTGYAVVFTRARAGKLYQIIVHGHGEFSAVQAYYIDKGLVTLDVDGYVQQPQYQNGGRSHARIMTRLGAVPQDVFDALSADFYEWSADHRLDGLACSLLVAELPPLDQYHAMWPGGKPVLEVVALTSPVYDPRTATTAYSDNVALCALDYERSADGGGLSDDQIDFPSFRTAADVCDQLVPLATGGTERRYRVALSVSLDDQPAAARDKFAAACGGQYFVTPQGKLGLRAGVWYAPRVTLTEAMVLTVDWTFGDDAVAGYNVAAFEYVDPALNFARVSGDPWRDEARIALQGEATQAPLIAAPSHRQCRAVAAIAMARDNPAQRLRITCKPAALVALYEPAVAVDLHHFGLSGTWQVLGVTLDPQKLVTTFDLALLPASAFAQSLVDQGTAPQFNSLSDEGGVPAVTGFNAGPLGIATSASTFAAGIGVAWNARPYGSLAPVLEYSATGADDWQSVPLTVDATAAQLSGLSDGSAYDVRLAWQAPGGALGPWAQEDGITAQAVTGIPAAPTSLAIEDRGAGVARVSWIASASAGHWKTEILRDGLLVGSLPGEPTQAGYIDDTAGAGAHSWTARAVNLSATASAETAPVLLTLA